MTWSTNQVIAVNPTVQIFIVDAQPHANAALLTHAAVLFHTLSDIPVDERALRVHHVVLLHDALGEHTAHSNVVADHGDIALLLRHDVVLDLGGRNLVEADLETGRAPLDERDLVVLLEPLDGGVGLLRLDLSTVVDGDRHVLV